MEILKKGRTDIHFLKEVKYGCRCGLCNTVLIAEYKDFSYGAQIINGDYVPIMACPICENRIFMSNAKKLRTNIDEDCFRKELE